MKIECELCGMEFSLFIFGETFGMTVGSDYNLHQINCPNLECREPILIKTIIYYDEIEGKLIKNAN